MIKTPHIEDACFFFLPVVLQERGLDPVDGRDASQSRVAADVCVGGASASAAGTGVGQVLVVRAAAVVEAEAPLYLVLLGPNLLGRRRRGEDVLASHRVVPRS